jgi:hypothetical protein
MQNVKSLINKRKRATLAPNSSTMDSKMNFRPFSDRLSCTKKAKGQMNWAAQNVRSFIILMLLTSYSVVLFSGGGNGSFP